MSAVVALSGQGGWPLNVFLTPEGKPFYGGTYYPHVAQPGVSSFKDVLETVIQMWMGDRERIDKSSNKLLDHLREQSHWISSPRPIQNSTLDSAVDALESSYDWFHGGGAQRLNFLNRWPLSSSCARQRVAAVAQSTWQTTHWRR